MDGTGARAHRAVPLLVRSMVPPLAVVGGLHLAERNLKIGALANVEVFFVFLVVFGLALNVWTATKR